MNKDILARLLGLNAAGRLAHAYVFAGPKGIGKAATALALAQAVNCLKNNPDPLACDCPSCRKIAAGNHPDVLVVARLEDKTVISIDQIRGMIERFEYRSLEARVKFALIKDAECISAEGANAFLKTLEEPRPGTVLILATSAPDSLLGTIRSRCQMVRFPALPPAALARALKAGYDVPADDAAILAAFGQGSPGRAMELGQDFLERRRIVLDAFFGLGDTEAFLKVAGADRVAAREALGVILMALRDALWIRTEPARAPVNRDRLVELRRFAQRYTPQELGAHADRVVDAMRRLDGNQNVKVVLTVVREMTLS